MYRFRRVVEYNIKSNTITSKNTNKYKSEIFVSYVSVGDPSSEREDTLQQGYIGFNVLLIL